MKKLINNIFILSVIVILLVTQTTFTTQASSNEYKDISGNWAELQIKDLINLGIFEGYNDNTIRPNDLITRAEFSKALLKALDIPMEASTSEQYFKDVKPEDWYYAPITILKQKSIIDGYDDGTFRPQRNISRAEMIVMLVRVSKEKLKQNNNVTLYKDIPLFHWAYWEIRTASKAGLIANTGEKFKPDEYVGRAEVAYSLDKMLWNQKSNVVSEKVIEFANNYNSEVNSKYNSNSTKLEDLENMSAGSQLDVIDTLKRRNKLHQNMGIEIDRTMNLYNSNIRNTSNNLVQIDFEYDLTKKIYFKNSMNTIFKKGLLTYFLKKSNNQWKVYSKETIPICDKFKDQNKKVNLVWDYIYKSANSFKGGKINGLDVISPTWFYLKDSEGNIGSKANKAYVKDAHSKGYQVWALASNSFDPELTSKVLRNPMTRKKVVDELVGYVDSYKLDGLNIDFENMNVKDKNLFTQFIYELSRPLRNRGVVLSVDVNTINENSNWSKCYDRKALANIVDYVAVMTYDQHWSTSPVSGSVAQLSWVENGIKDILKQVPNEKLLLGLPFYTREWKEVSSANGTKVTSTVLSMEEAKKRIKENNAKKVWDAESGQYYAEYSKNGATYKIWLENAKSIDLKSQLVEKYKLAGVASWRAGFETEKIWEVIKSNLNK